MPHHPHRPNYMQNVVESAQAARDENSIRTALTNVTVARRSRSLSRLVVETWSVIEFA
jgi:hypothetical protein